MVFFMTESVKVLKRKAVINVRSRKWVASADIYDSERDKTYKVVIFAATREKAYIKLMARVARKMRDFTIDSFNRKEVA